MIFRRRRRSYVDDLPEPHDARFLAIFLVVVVAVLGAVYLVGHVVAGDKVPGGTTVAGQRIGGLSRADAATALRRWSDRELARTVTATVAGQRMHVAPRDAGIRLDVDATIDDAMAGGDWDPRHMLKVIEGGGAVQPVYRVDRRRLAAALSPLATAVETKPRSYAVSVLGGRPTIRPGRPGRHLDLRSAPGLLTAAAHDSRARATLELTSDPPDVTFAEARGFVNGTLRPALGGPAVVRVGKTSLRVVPDQFAPALRVDSTTGRLQLRMDAEVLQRRTAALLGRLPGRPVDARFVFTAGRPVVVPSRQGRTVSPGDWADAVLTAVTSDARRATARSTVASASFTTADARALHLQSRLGAASAGVTARFAAAVRAAATRLDRSIVLPGADFSYTKAVGPANAATVLSPLGRATLTAAERAGLHILQRPLPSQFARELQVRNDSDFPVYVRAWTRPSAHGAVVASVEVWGSGG